TGEWLAEQLEKEPVTVSKWCTNSSQPNLQTLYKIAELLNLDIIARAKTNYSIRRLE
ncbi:helix-turn-helix domain-containing protein, partial [Bacteroides acidifaciens]|uniref:helix-turn-helix domain-containing protein n=2 Tax=Bacteroides TaxID=816 RepID=UPI0025A9BE3F